MSMPRAAMSVATSTCRSPFLKSASALVRAVWLLLPWIAIAVMSCFSRCSTRRLAPCFMRVKTSTWCQSLSLTRWTSRSFFISRPTGCTFCAISSAVWLRRATSISTGAFSSRSAIALISSLKVAEKSRLCFFCGSTASTFLMSWMKPMSSMRSASSRTKISTCERSSVRWPWWSSSRPGVATRMSTPRRSLSICGCMPTPPNITMLESLACLP